MDLSMQWLSYDFYCDMQIIDFVSALTRSGSNVDCFEQEG